MRRLGLLGLVPVLGLVCLGCSQNQSGSGIPIHTLAVEASKDPALNGAGISDWMNASAQASVQSFEGGYQIVRQTAFGTTETTWIFEDEGVIYSANTIEDSNHPLGIRPVNLIRASDDGQTNVNLTLDGEGTIVSANSFERDPLYNTKDGTFLKMPLIELISTDGFEVIQSFPEEFEGNVDTGNPMSVTWTVKDPESLHEQVSKSRFSKSGFYAAAGLSWSWTMKPDGCILSAKADNPDNPDDNWSAEVSPLENADEQKQQIIDCFNQYPVLE